MIEYRIRRHNLGSKHAEANKLVAEVYCSDCGVAVCIAETDTWPPSGPVTLFISRGWPEPEIVGDEVFCGECGGVTTSRG